MGIFFLLVAVIIIATALGISWLIGRIGYYLVGASASNLKYILMGILGQVGSGFMLSFGERQFDVFQDFEWVVIPVGWLLSIIVVACILMLFRNNKKDSRDKVESDLPDIKKNNYIEEESTPMKDLNYKSLVRIPVWALYSLIVATVIMSFVMLVNIWFPETIDEELIWKIILSYGVFLISALVISNLTDKIKEMKKYENEG